MEKFKCGHDKSEENTGWTNSKNRKGYYRCLTCDKAKSAAYQKRNAEKVNAYHRTWHQKNPEKMAQYKRLWKYKLTPEQYQALYEKNNGLCHICNAPDIPHKNGATSFNIDHDHACCSGRKTCGKCTRGLICFSCNRMLGSLERRNIADVLKYIGYKGETCAGK